MAQSSPAGHATPPRHPHPPSSSSPGSLSDASTATDLSSSLDDSGSDSDFNPARVNFGPQKTPERRFLRKVRRKDSREFYRRQTINWGLDGEGRDTIERKEGDDQGQQQDLSDELEQGVRIEDGRADDREDEVDPSTRPESSSLATPSKPSATSSPSQLTQEAPTPSAGPRSSPPAYDGDAESEDDDGDDSDEACMVEVLGRGGRPSMGGVDDSFDEVPEQEDEHEDRVEDESFALDETDAPASDSQNDEPGAPELPSHGLASPDRPPHASSSAASPRSPLSIRSAESEMDSDMEATFVDEHDSDWEDELPSREEPDDLTDAFANERTFVAEDEDEEEEQAADGGSQADVDMAEASVERDLDQEEDAAELELEAAQQAVQVAELAEPADETAVVDALERLALDAEQVPGLQASASDAVAPADEVVEFAAGEQATEDTSSVSALEQPSMVNELVKEEVSTEEPQVTVESASSPEVSINTPTKSMLSFLDSSPTPYHSLPVLLPTPTQVASSSRAEHQAEESFVSQSPELATLVQDQSIVMGSENEAEVEAAFDASAVSSTAPEMAASPSKPDSVDEDVEYGRNGPAPLVVQILASPSELSPLPSSGSDSSASLVQPATPTPPSSTTPRARTGAKPVAAAPTPLRPNESVSSSSSTSATPPSHARKQAADGQPEKRPASKVLKRASPQKSAAALEKKADRLAQNRVRAQLDAAMARSGPSPIKSASKPPPRALDATMSRSFGPSPRVGFVRTLSRVTSSPTASTSTSTSRLPPRTLAQSQASASTAKALTPQPLQRSTAAAPPPPSVPRSILKKTQPLPPSAAPPPPAASSSRPIFAARAAPPQPASALKSSRTTTMNASAGPSTLKPAPVSHLPKPSTAGSSIPKPASFLSKGPSARVPPPLASSSSRPPLGGNPRPGSKQALKTHSSWSSAGAPASSHRRAGGDMSISMPVSATASFSRSGGGGGAAESESSFRMDSSFRMESPRTARPTLGEPVRFASPMKASARHASSTLSSGPVRMGSPVKTASFGSSLGSTSHLNRAGRDGPFGASIFAQSVSAHVPGTFSEHKPPPSPPRKAASNGGAFLASIADSLGSKATSSLRDGKCFGLPAETASSSTSKEPSPMNDSRPTTASSSPPSTAAPSSPTTNSTKSDPTPAAPPPPSRSSDATAPTSTTTPARSLRTRAPPPPPEIARAAPAPVASSSRPKASQASAADTMSVVQLKSFTLANTKKNQVYFSALEKVVVRRDGETRPVSPGEKVKKAGKEWEEKAAAGGKKRKPLFDASDSGDEGSSDEEVVVERKTHVRGPGEEEDFFSPVKSSSASKGGRSKKSRGGAGEESGAASASQKKGVKWDKGLVWIRSRKHESLELEGEGDGGVGMTRGRKAKKGCLRSLKVPLDQMGNLPLTLPPLTDLIKRDKVTYTQIVYDDDPAAAAPPPAAKGKGKK